MMKDRYGNALTTASAAARDAYVAGVDLFFAAQDGADQRFAAAIGEDPNFALAHIARGRLQQTLGKPQDASASLAKARAARGLTPREASQVDALGSLLEGRGAEAYGKIKAHLAEHPRDAMVAQPCIGVFGLIGFSGRKGREAEQLAFTTALAPHFGDDWWFLGGHAFAEMEAGLTGPAEITIERSLALNPKNANSAHYRSHLHYENGESAAGAAYIGEWMRGYAKGGFLHTHIAWHIALWALEAGDEAAMWRIVEADVLPGGASGPPTNVITDSAAILYRAALAGADVPDGMWETVSAYATEFFPKPGIAFVDVHAALAHAMAGRGEALERIVKDAAGPAADIVAPLASGFSALATGDWAGAVRIFAPHMATHERIGGSRAQRDLLEFAYAAALLRSGEADAARLTLLSRRPASTPPGAISGL